MNITHATTEKVRGDRLEAIFNRQKELMEKYHSIEHKSGLMQTEDCPVDLNDKRGQARIKDFAWRFMEEVGEALDSMDNEEHFREELVDALHFLTELTLLTGKTADTMVNVPSWYDSDKLTVLATPAIRKYWKHTTEQLVCDLVRELGMMCNCLKNKPWKQTQMLTDKEVFYQKLSNVWVTHLALMFRVGMSLDSITESYLKKSQVNKFRQRTNY